MHEPGNISVKHDWRQLAVDTEHYRQGQYLSMVDCGPNGMTIWKELKMGTADEVERTLNEIFLELGPVGELFVENGTEFRSEMLKIFD